MGFNIFTRQLAADTQSPSAAGRGLKTGYVQQAHREFAASAGSDEEREIKSAAYTQQGGGLHKS
jgi:D-alanyl-D-alanine carboxypeptidase